MGKIEGLKINESYCDLENGHKAKIAVFIYSGGFDPKPFFKKAIRQYVGDIKNYYLLIDSHMDCPWVRVVVSNIDKFTFTYFDQTNFPNLKISENEYSLDNGEKAKFTIFFHGGTTSLFDSAITKYVGKKGYHEFITEDLWYYRFILSNINDMKQVDFDPDVHNIDIFE
jgi:hypothetical protein